MSILLVVELFVFGLIFGSFINALVWRTHEQLDEDGNAKKLSKKKQKELSIIKGRSMCPHCKHELAVMDLLPVVSWVALKGKCRYCKKPISKEYPVVELLTALLFVGVYLAWPYNLIGSEWVLFISWLGALVPLIALAVYDAKWYVLPTRLIYVSTAIYASGLLLYSVIAKDTDRLGWSFIAAIAYFVLFYCIFMASSVAKHRGWSSKEWLGFGDVRLAFLLGLLVGTPGNVFVAIFLASIIGLIVALPGLLAKKMEFTTLIPFGPFLISGAVVAFLFGDRLIGWYVTTFLGF